MRNRFKRIIIFGAGNVGATIAAFLIERNLATEVLLFDRKPAFLRAQILDLQDHALNRKHPIKVEAARWQDCDQAEIIIIAAGQKQQPAQTRDALATTNGKMIIKFLAQLKRTTFAGFIIVVTNPVEQMTALVHRFSGLLPPRIIGTGTSLDALRLKNLAHTHFLNFSLSNLALIGEHGVEIFLPKLMNTRFYRALARTSFKLTDLITQICALPFTIIRGKKATYYGIANVVVKIILQLKRPKPVVMNLSVLFNDTVISHPCYISQIGILPQTPFLEESEQTQFHALLSKMAAKQTALFQALMPLNSKN